MSCRDGAPGAETRAPRPREWPLAGALLLLACLACKRSGPEGPAPSASAPTKEPAAPSVPDVPEVEVARTDCTRAGLYFRDRDSRGQVDVSCGATCRDLSASDADERVRIVCRFSCSATGASGTVPRKDLSDTLTFDLRRASGDRFSGTVHAARGGAATASATFKDRFVEADGQVSFGGRRISLTFRPCPDR